MGFLAILVIALALGTDAFAMALGMGILNVRYKQIIIISLMILIFHIIMPLIGVYLGALAGSFIGRLAETIGALLLTFMGILMLREGFKSDDGDGIPKLLKSLGIVNKDGGKFSINIGFWGCIVLAISLSIDALTVGFGLGALNFNLVLTVLTIGLVAGIMTVLGFLLGKKVGSWLGDKAQIIGGVMLIGVGISMLL